jgi:energy-coupling factor transport system permease protein
MPQEASLEMLNRDTFSSYHPIVNFVYFALVIIFSMIFMHPACLIISLACATAYNINLNGRKSLRFALVFMLPLFLVAGLVNPAFNHEGATILTYLPSGNPLTLESIIYGIAAAAMLIAVISWFNCYNTVMSSDKFVYLFGRIIPSMSLVLSMTLRFVPRFAAQIKIISNAQKCIGRDVSNGGITQRARNGITILSIMITWALENAIETADSMKSRGYGLKGRSAFSIYRFEKRDGALLSFLLACGLYIVLGGFGGSISWQYFPVMKATGTSTGFYSVSIFICYLFLCMTPVIINIVEDIKWKALQSAV